MKHVPGQRFLDGSVACLGCGRRLRTAAAIAARRGATCAKKIREKKQRRLFPPGRVELIEEVNTDAE